MVKVALPVSHLLESMSGTDRILSYADCLECRDSTISSTLPGQELFHTDLQPVYPLSQEDLDYISRIRKTRPALKVLSFHLASCYRNPLLRAGVFHPQGRKHSPKELLDTARMNLAKIKSLVGSSVFIAVENNNYYPTDAYDVVTNGYFISKLVEDNDIYLLLDLAHARITAANSGRDLGDYCSSLPLQRTVQIHFSRAEHRSGMLFDTHGRPHEQDIMEAIGYARKYQVEYITPEYYNDVESLYTLLQEMRALL